VANLLATGASSLCSRVLVLAVKAKSFDGKTGGGDLDESTARRFSMPRGQASVLDAAIKAGGYVGPVPPSAVHAGLRALLGGAPDQVYVAPVLVSERPALLVLLAGLDDARTARDRMAQLVRKAGFAVERIVLSRKL
jgi:hypothetical protein